MRTIIILLFILLALLTLMSKAQTYSDITYTSGTSVEVQTGADVCADDIFFLPGSSWSGGGTICNGSLPVSLSSFTHTVNQRNVTLQWTTEWELNNAGFDIERRTKNGQWSKIAFVTGHGTTNEQKTYQYTDEKLKKGVYEYRLKQTDYNGSYEYYDLQSDVTINPPGKFDISQNYPNPSNPNSKINFELPVDGRVAIKVYDITGREVKTLIDEFKPADYYTIEFDGTNLASGVYFYRIVAEGEGQKFTRTLKMILVK